MQLDKHVIKSRTKIVATLGPASRSAPVLEALIREGVAVIRLNLSHGDVGDHLASVTGIRAASRDAGVEVAILADLPGPKVRSGQFPPEGCDLLAGDAIILVPGDVESSASRIEVDYPTLCDDVESDDRIVLGDGAISMKVTAVDELGVRCQVLTGGKVQGRPGVHLPSERLRLSTPTAEDIELAATMADAGVDFLAVSFVRSADDLRTLRAALAPRHVRLVAKIETSTAIDNLSAIADEADAVMVARGDLGIECPLEDVPHLQKRIIRHCVEWGVPVITATQVVESMITSPSPTRAEVTDIANAVFDGTDALMLSAETAVGIDPVNVVVTMNKVAARAEGEASYSKWATRLGQTQRAAFSDSVDRITMAITHAAGLAATDAGADAILCCTRSGRTAIAMARFRPSLKLVALSPDPSTVRALALSWGVTALHVDTYHTTDDVVWHAVESAVQAGHVSEGQTVLVLAGAPDRASGASTDVLRIVRVS